MLRATAVLRPGDVPQVVCQIAPTLAFWNKDIGLQSTMIERVLGLFVLSVFGASELCNSCVNLLNFATYRYGDVARLQFLLKSIVLAQALRCGEAQQ